MEGRGWFGKRPAPLKGAFCTHTFLLCFMSNMEFWAFFQTRGTGQGSLSQPPSEYRCPQVSATWSGKQASTRGRAVGLPTERPGLQPGPALGLT